MSLLRRFCVLLVVASFAFSPLSAQSRLAPEQAETLLVNKVTPDYPFLAKKAELQGTVKLELRVSESGEVVSATILSGHPLLVTAAQDAVKQWKYKPFISEGKPSAFVTTVEVPFSLGISNKDYEKLEKMRRAYFDEDERCRKALERQDIAAAKSRCRAALEKAKKLGDEAGLTKMGAHENLGHAFLYAGEYRAALGEYTQAYEWAVRELKEVNAEYGYTCRNMAIANHRLGNLEDARSFYLKAEKSLQLAVQHIGSAELEGRYKRGLMQLYQLHIQAATADGASSEAEQAREQLQKLQSTLDGQ